MTKIYYRLILCRFSVFTTLATPTLSGKLHVARDAFDYRLTIVDRSLKTSLNGLLILHFKRSVITLNTYRLGRERYYCVSVKYNLFPLFTTFE